jgi:hypothetical protein
MNNARTRTGCALCENTRYKPDIGPAIVLYDGAWTFVCDDCAWREAPELYLLLRDKNESEAKENERTPSAD